MKIAIFLNEYKPSNTLMQNIKIEANKYGFVINNNDPDIVFYIGGDGTFLRAVKHYYHILDKVSFVGISNANLGFFYEFNKEDVQKVFSLINKNELISVKHHLLEASLEFENNKEVYYAVNEFRIENPFHTFDCQVFIDGIHLEHFKGNGLMICTSLGSSGYNRSLGGAFVDHHLEAIELTEIAGLQNNCNCSLGSSFVLSGKSKIMIKAQFSNAVFGFDNTVLEKKNPLSLIITQSNKVVSVLHDNCYSYISSIKRSFTK